MQKMDEILNQISVEITRDRTAQSFISKNDLDYAYGQMNQKKQVDNAYSQSPGQNSADTTYLKRGFTDWPTYAQYSRGKLTEH